MKAGLFPACLVLLTACLARAELKLATFDVDATPPDGSALTYDPMKEAGELTLRARGFALSGAGEPVVVCAVDWIGIGNAGHDAFRDALAAAAGTTRERVAVQALHQHDAPICDFSAAAVLEDAGLPAIVFDRKITQPVIDRAAAALKEAMTRARPVTHVSMGRAEVREVASNRRIVGEDGKVRAVRFTTTKDPALRAEPEGVIDSQAVVIGLWDGEKPVVALSYYATHPQSYYRTGVANPDFPGMARFLRQTDVPGVLHVHFTGAGGNIGAGKYNDGATENRPVLAKRLADGLARAWAAAEKRPLGAEDVGWEVERVTLAPAAHLKAEELAASLSGGQAKPASILGTAAQLAWVRRMEGGTKLEISCLRLGSARILHMPGELFVEYQLAAAQLRPDLTVAMAAYGDYGPGYIGTARAYAEGGYETQPDSSFVGPEAEAVLTGAVKKLLAR